MAKKPLNDQEIIELISKLREETPEYPPELMKSRKSGFLERVAELKDSGSDRGGGGRYGGGSGGDSEIRWSASGALGGGTATSGFSTKTALFIGLAVVLLTLAYLFRNQIVDFLAENEIITVQETATPTCESLSAVQKETPTATILSGSGAPADSETPRAGAASSGLGTMTPAAPGFGDGNGEGVPVTGDSGEPTQTTQTPGFSRPTATPTPKSPDNSITGRLRYIVCILRGGGDDCE